MITEIEKLILMIIVSSLIINHVQSFRHQQMNYDENSAKCMEFEVQKIDAITYLKNGSRLIIIDSNYWLLNNDEIPTIKAKKSILDLISPEWQTKLLKKLNEIKLNDQMNTNRSEIDLDENNQFRIDSAVNIELKASKGKCIPTNQLLLYSTLPDNNGPLITVHENENIYTSSKISDFDLLTAAKSVDFSKKIDAMTYFNNMTIIFQEKYFTTVRCINGRWSEVFHKEIDQVFPKAMIEPDSVDMSRLNSELLYDNTYVLLFYQQQYLSCSVLGNSPCEGPYDITKELFNVNHLCFDISELTENTAIIMYITVILIAAFIIALILFIYYKKTYPYSTSSITTTSTSPTTRSSTQKPRILYSALKIPSNDNHMHIKEKSSESSTNGKV